MGTAPREGYRYSHSLKQIEKKCKKPLDKPHKVWYNLNVIKGRKTLKTRKELITMANTTTSTPKMTKAQKFAIIAELPEVKSNPMLSEFIAHEMELLSKKNSAEKKPTAQQTANEGIKTAILDGMESGKAYTITEIIKSVPECADLTNQRVSALMRQMVENGTVARTEDKRKAYFTKVG